MTSNVDSHSQAQTGFPYTMGDVSFQEKMEHSRMEHLGNPPCDMCHVLF